MTLREKKDCQKRFKRLSKKVAIKEQESSKYKKRDVPKDSDRFFMVLNDMKSRLGFLEAQLFPGKECVC